MFKAPTDPTRREQWAQNIKRANKELTNDSMVCERHFEEQFIERTYQRTINGEVVEIPHDRPHLKEDAKPTLFPDAPKYFTKKAPIERKDRNLCEQCGPTAKRRKLNAVSSQDDQREDVAADAQLRQEQQEASYPEGEIELLCANFRLPVSTWNK